MAVYVHGTNPTDTAGKFFRARLHNWATVTDYLAECHPALSKQEGLDSPDLDVADCDWFSTTGDGLNAAEAEALGRAIGDDVDSGALAHWITAEWHPRHVLPTSTCTCPTCSGTGLAPAPGAVRHRRARCGACLGMGLDHAFEVATVTKFAAFLVHSGGFAIY